MVVLCMDLWTYAKKIAIYNVTFNNIHKVVDYIITKLDDIIKSIFKFLKNIYGSEDIIIFMGECPAIAVYVNYKYVRWLDTPNDMVIYEDIKINDRYRLFYGKLVDYRDIDLVERIDYVNDPLMKLLNKL